MRGGRDAKKEKKENYKIMKIASDRNALKLHLFRLMEVWGFEGGVGVVVAMAGKLAETSACVCVCKGSVATYEHKSFVCECSFRGWKSGKSNI